MNYLKYFLLLNLLAFSFLAASQNKCLPEDCVNSTNIVVNQSSGVLAASQIPAPTIDLVEIDYDQLPVGSVTVEQIKQQFPTANLSDIIPTFGVSNLLGDYNFQLDGQALAWTNGNQQNIIAPNSAFDDIDSMRVVLSSATTEVGFRIGDWGGPFNIFLYQGGTQVGDVTVDTDSNNGPFYIQSTVEFDEFVLTALPQNPAGNWVNTALYLPTGPPPAPPVPTMSQWALLLLGLLIVSLGVVGIYNLKKHQGLVS